MNKFRTVFVSCGLVSLLVSCGGSTWNSSSSVTPTVTSTLTFPLASAWRVASEFASYKSYSISGSCMGGASFSNGDAVPATFEASSAVSVSSSELYSFMNCSPSNITGSGLSYFDSNFNSLGSVNSNGEYGVYNVLAVVPALVKVGDSGSLGTKTLYSNNSKSAITGRDESTYVIEPDTATTAIVDFISKNFDSSGILLATTHNRYRISEAGDLIPVSADIRSSSIHLVLTPNIGPTSPLVVVTTKPIGNSIINATKSVSVTFNKPMDATTLSNSTFLVTAGGAPVSGTVSYLSRTATFTPASPMPEGALNATITKEVKDIEGMSLSSSNTWLPSEYSWALSVDAAAPTITSISPVDLATKVATGYISATFSEAMDPASITSANFIVMNGTTPIPGTVSYSANTAIFTPTVPFTQATHYTAEIKTGMTDAAGNPLATGRQWSFTTFALNPTPTSALSQSVAYQNNPAHTGFVSFGTPLVFPATPTWSQTLSGTISYPLIAGGKVFVTTGGFVNGTQLHALDLATGSVAWGPVTIANNTWWSGLAYDHGKVFVVNSDGGLTAFDAATGNVGWSVQLQGQTRFLSPPTAVNGIIYLVGEGMGGAAYAIDESNGSVVWTAPVSGSSWSSPTVTGDGVYITFRCEAYKLDPLSGAILWHYRGACTGHPGLTAPVANGTLYLRDLIQTTGLKLDATTGIQTGTFDVYTTPAFSNQAGFFLLNALYTYDLTTDAYLWGFSGVGLGSTPPIVIDQVVVAGNRAGDVIAVDVNNGAQIWSGNAGALIPSSEGIYASQPISGLGAGEGYLVVPAGNVLTAWRIIP